MSRAENFWTRWRRGWDSDSLLPLIPRKLLISRSAATDKTARNAEPGYTWGTRALFQKPLSVPLA